MDTYQGMQALVVDDESTTRFLLREALESLGMVVTEAVDGADAIHKSLMTQFELTTMDILMPNVDGLDAIHAMRTVDPSCRIVVVTSCKEARVAQALRELDVPFVVHKPVRLDALYAAVREVLALTTPAGAAVASEGPDASHQADPEE